MRDVQKLPSTFFVHLNHSLDVTKLIVFFLFILVFSFFHMLQCKRFNSHFLFQVTRWFTNPLTLGSYSYLSLRTEREGVTQGDLAEPTHEGRVLWAGEATSLHHYSTVHGAIETGRREAERSLNGNL